MQVHLKTKQRCSPSLSPIRSTPARFATSPVSSLISSDSSPLTASNAPSPRYKPSQNNIQAKKHLFIPTRKISAKKYHQHETHSKSLPDLDILENPIQSENEMEPSCNLSEILKKENYELKDKLKNAYLKIQKLERG